MYSYEMNSSPTLRTVQLVEKLLSENTFDLFSKAEIIRRLNGRINNQTLTTILEYLERDGKILQSSKGIQWCHHPNREFIKKILKRGTTLTSKDIKKIYDDVFSN